MPGETDVELVRRVLARELETINEYESYARMAEAPSIRSFFQHLAGEEKEHVAEALLLIRQLDPGQEQKLSSPDLSVEHLAGNRSALGPSPEPPAPTGASPMPTFTVGPLRTRAPRGP